MKTKRFEHTVRVFGFQIGRYRFEISKLLKDTNKVSELLKWLKENNE